MSLSPAITSCRPSIVARSQIDLPFATLLCIGPATGKAAQRHIATQSLPTNMRRHVFIDPLFCDPDWPGAGTIEAAMKLQTGRAAFSGKGKPTRREAVVLAHLDGGYVSVERRLLDAIKEVVVL